MPDSPLPFRLPVPGRDSVSFGGFESVSYKLDGLMHVTPTTITLEWTGTLTTEKFTFEKIGTDVDALPLEWVELPIDEIAAVRLIGGWWRPRLELRARLLDSFEGVPTSRGAVLRLPIARRDRAVAKNVVAEIDMHLETVLLAESDRPQLER